MCAPRRCPLSRLGAVSGNGDLACAVRLPESNSNNNFPPKQPAPDTVSAVAAYPGPQIQRVGFMASESRTRTARERERREFFKRIA